LARSPIPSQEKEGRRKNDLGTLKRTIASSPDQSQKEEEKRGLAIFTGERWSAGKKKIKCRRIPSGEGKGKKTSMATAEKGKREE